VASPRRLPLAAAAAAAAALATGSATAAPTAASCVNLAPPPPLKQVDLKPPRTRLDPKKRWTATVTTNCGTFSFVLDVKSSPRTSASFAMLAGRHYFDGTIFHRIVPGFVIQGGDRTQSGGGGPGYATIDPPPSNTRYVRGVVAMAKTGADPAGTSGSQFFVVTAAVAPLPPDYAVLGRVTQGLAVVLKIGKLGDPATEKPTQPIVISRLRVTSG
jgi:cyclophilin family peptidyl-prolyl cis-trans isomerase